MSTCSTVMDSPHAKCPKDEVFIHRTVGTATIQPILRPESGLKAGKTEAEPSNSTQHSRCIDCKPGAGRCHWSRPRPPPINAADSNSPWSACTTALGCSVFAATSSSKAASAGPPTSRNSGTSSASILRSIHRSTGHCFVATGSQEPAPQTRDQPGPAVPDTTASRHFQVRPPLHESVIALDFVHALLGPCGTRWVKTGTKGCLKAHGSVHPSATPTNRRKRAGAG